MSATLCLALACRAEDVLLVPDFDSQAVGVLIVLELADASFQVQALDVTSQPVTLRLGTSGDFERVWVLEYPYSIEALGLVSGEVPLVPRDEGLAIPRPLRIQTSAEDANWVDQEDVPEQLEDFALARPSLEACLADQGCYVAFDDVGGAACLIPCPEPSRIAEPEPPMPPELLPCLAGWTEVEVQTVTYCQPWSNGARPTCSAGEANFADDVNCVSIGATCPADRWGTPPSGSVVFVDGSAGGGGDGTMDRPFDGLSEALAAAPDGATLYLAEGDYGGQLSISRDISVVGVCVAGVAITAPELGNVFSVVGGGQLTLSDVTLSGGANGVVATGGGRLDAARVEIAGPADVAVLLDSGVHRLERLRVRDASGVAIELALGATLNATDIDIERAQVGLRLSGASTFADVDGIILVDTATSAVRVEDGARASISSLIIEDVKGDGISINGADSHLSGENWFLRNLLDASGRPLSVREAGGVQVERVVIDESFGGVRFVDAGGELADVYLGARPPGTWWASVLIFGEGDVSLSRVAVLDARGDGIVMRGLSTTQADDVEVFATTRVMERGHAFSGGAGATFVGRRIRIHRSESDAFRWAGEVLELYDFDVLSSGVGIEGDCEHGLSIESSEATVERIRIRDALANGLECEDCTMTMRDASFGPTLGDDGCRGSYAMEFERSDFNVERFEAFGGRVAGIQLVEATGTIKDGVIRDNPIGVRLISNPQPFDFDRVRFRDNDVLFTEQ